MRIVFSFAILLLCQLSVSRADMIYVTTKWGNDIETFDENGNRSVFASGLSGPQGIAFDQSGNLYVDDSLNNRILKYTGTVPSVFATTGLNAPRGITFDAAGNLLVANYWAYNIMKYSPDGQGTVVAWNWWYHADDIAFDNSGNMFVASSEGNEVLKYTLDGRQTVLPLYGLSQPDGLAFDKNGNLFIASSGNNLIYKVDKQGNQTVFANSGLCAPQGLAFDSSGNLYVANSWILNNIVKFDPNGNQLWSAATSDGPVFIAIQVPEPSEAVFQAVALCLGLFGCGVMNGVRFRLCKFLSLSE